MTGSGPGGATDADGRGNGHTSLDEPAVGMPVMGGVERDVAEPDDATDTLAPEAPEVGAGP